MKSDLFRQKLLETEAQNRVGLSSANLHQRPRMARDLTDEVGKLLCPLFIPILGLVLHWLSLSSESSGTSLRYSKTRVASFSSSRLMATPTCTMT